MGEALHQLHILLAQLRQTVVLRLEASRACSASPCALRVQTVPRRRLGKYVPAQRACCSGGQKTKRQEYLGGLPAARWQACHETNESGSNSTLLASPLLLPCRIPEGIRDIGRDPH